MDLDCGGGDAGGDGGTDGGGSPGGPEGGMPASSEWGPVAIGIIRKSNWGLPSEKGASLKSLSGRTTKCSREGVAHNCSRRELSIGGKGFGAVSWRIK